jgi:tetratricopeptide (TPR) repeat protein
MRKSVYIALIASAAALASPKARAEESSSTLFAEGQRLMEKGDFAAACPKFEKALSINAGVGTKFNLGECYEKTGRLASALALFRDVEDITRQAGQADRSTAAKQRADALEPRVPTVVVRAPWAASAPAAKITLDGRALARGELDKPIRVDFGAHEAVAELEGRQSRAKATIDKEGVSTPLALESPAPAPPPPPPPPESSWSTQRTIGLVVGGVGVVAAGVGGVLALKAKSDYGDATASCGTACPHDEATRANDARSLANVGGVVFVAGLVVAGGGVALFLTAPSSSSKNATRLRFAPSAAGAPAGVTVAGAF